MDINTAPQKLSQIHVSLLALNIIIWFLFIGVLGAGSFDTGHIEIKFKYLGNAILGVLIISFIIAAVLSKYHKKSLEYVLYVLHILPALILLGGLHLFGWV